MLSFETAHYAETYLGSDSYKEGRENACRLAQKMYAFATVLNEMRHTKTVVHSRGKININK